MRKHSQMQMLLTNFGTRGDFEPLCALAQYAREMGDNPVFAVPEGSCEFVRGFGFTAVPLRGDLSAIRDEINVACQAGCNDAGFVDKLSSLLLRFEPFLLPTFNQLVSLCRHADVLIGGAAQPLSRAVHEHLGIPFVSVQVSNFGGYGGEALRKGGDLLVNPFRRKLGLCPVDDALTSGANSNQLTLYAMSHHFSPIRDDESYSAQQITGFLFTQVTENLDVRIKEFIERGSPPVIVTFGSMAHYQPAQLAELMVNVCAKTNTRAIVQGHTAVEQVSDHILMTGFVRHQLLFDHASCVVLHGGAGTTAAVFRAGIPGIFVPHSDIYDQPYWARLAREAGCAAEAIPLAELTANNLADAISESLTNGSLRANAAQVGSIIRRENGVREAWLGVSDLISRIGLCA